jgi:hypothetical protein
MNVRSNLVSKDIVFQENFIEGSFNTRVSCSGKEEAYRPAAAAASHGRGCAEQRGQPNTPLEAAQAPALLASPPSQTSPSERIESALPDDMMLLILHFYSLVGPEDDPSADAAGNTCTTGSSLIYA